MKLTFLKAKYGIEFKIPKEFVKVLNKTFEKKSNLGVFCAVQFREHLNVIRKIMEKEGFTTITSKPFRTSIEGQILGCDSYADALQLDLSEIDGFVYIGDGYFHPNALLLAQEREQVIKPVIVVNVVQQIVEVIGEQQISKYIKKKRGNLMKFYSSENIGVFVTSKWGRNIKRVL